MGIFRKIQAFFHDDWCSHCQAQMYIESKQLFMLPDMSVGHYISHEHADYYRRHLCPVTKKADIPIGTYACGMHLYRCSSCGHLAVKLTVFLPVREEEKLEQILYFDHGELDGFALGRMG